MIEVTNDPHKIGAALGWIVSQLNRYNIPYQICGGLAAKAYGAKRPLVDIDIYASLQSSPHLQTLLTELEPYTVRAFGPHLSDSWDIYYLALSYQGIYIELADSTSPHFYNHRDGRWEDQVITFAVSTLMTLYGVDVALMPKDELLTYKIMLNRDVDQLDIADMNANALQ